MNIYIGRSKHKKSIDGALLNKIDRLAGYILKMEKDILSIFVSNEVTGTLIKKLYRLALILLVISSIYWLLDFMEWYSFLRKASASVKNDPKNFYVYKLRPVLSVLLMAFSLMGQILNYKGYGHVSASIKSSDPVLLNKGFRNFTTTYVLAFSSYFLSIINIGYRLLK